MWNFHNLFNSTITFVKLYYSLSIYKYIFFLIAGENHKFIKAKQILSWAMKKHWRNLDNFLCYNLFFMYVLFKIKKMEFEIDMLKKSCN